MRKFLLVVMLVCFGSGCYTMKHTAPPQSSVTLLPEGSSTDFQKSKKVWYALWGAVPISSNSSEKIILENDLRQVRIKTRITFVDYLIGFFTGAVSIVPATMTVEGNHESMEEAQADPFLEKDMGSQAETALPHFRSAVPGANKSTDEEILNMFRKKNPRLKAKSDDELIKMIEKKYDSSEQ